MKVAVVCALLLAVAAAQTCISNGGISYSAENECVWQGQAAYNGTVLVAGAKNLQGIAQACCDSCRNSTGSTPCNSWTWCGNPGGCCAERAGCNASSSLVPHLACTLLFTEALEYADESPKPSYTYNATDVAKWAAGTNTTALTSGVTMPTIMEPEQLSGYTALPGQDVTGDDYRCPATDYIGSIVGGCRLNGTVTELASGCSSDPKCSAFTYQPFGCCSSSESNELYESGWRKTGDVNPSCTTLLPHTTVYIKQSASS